jgi:mRNA-degrading endonuclease toxin of MazEF toxin-antitoxin module
MTDELELVHEDHLEDRRGVLSPSTMDAISTALRHVLPLR